MKRLQIGQLAQSFGLAPHILRHWEAMGLLSPAARVGGRRLYDERHVRRVAIIVRAQEAGLSLGDLRDMLRAPNPVARRAALERHKANLEARLADIVASKKLIEHALECSYDDFTQCPAFQRAIQGVVERYSKVHATAKPTSACPVGRRLASRKLHRKAPG